MTRRKIIYYVTDGRYNYAECISEKDANEEIARLTVNDERARKMWMNKLGYIPSDVDIPQGYYVTTNQYD